jgi:hypothetical protein
VIVFAPSYDEATQANHAVARRLCEGADEFLGGDSATHLRLTESLATRSVDIFALSHGEPDALLAQGGRGAPRALSTKSNVLSSLRDRCIFIHACYTARELGPAAARAGGLFWGYDRAVNAPESEPPLVDVFVTVFTFIKTSFIGVRSPTQIDAFFTALQVVCENARNDLDRDKDNLGPLSAHQCLLQIQNDLRVWRPGAAEPHVPAQVRGLGPLYF